MRQRMVTRNNPMHNCVQVLSLYACPSFLTLAFIIFLADQELTFVLVDGCSSDAWVLLMEQSLGLFLFSEGVISHGVDCLRGREMSVCLNDCGSCERISTRAWCVFERTVLAI